MSEAKRLRELVAETAKLKRIVADQVLDMSAMKELLAKTGDARGEAESRGHPDWQCLRSVNGGPAGLSAGRGRIGSMNRCRRTTRP